MNLDGFHVCATVWKLILIPSRAWQVTWKPVVTRREVSRCFDRRPQTMPLNIDVLGYACGQRQVSWAKNLFPTNAT